MNFFKKVFGFGGEDLKKVAESTKIDGTLYRVIKDARNIMYLNDQIRFNKCTITFQFTQNQYLIVFINQESSEGSNSSYAFPIHSEMNLVSFNMSKGEKAHSCFEWCLDDTGEHVGCYMDPKNKENFRDITCKALKVILNDENIKDHLKLCKDLPGIPVYKVSQESESTKSLGVNSKISQKSQASLQINNVLIKQAAKEENRMVHSASYYEIVDKERKLIKDQIVFVLKEVGNFQFEFQLINATGYTFLRKQLTPGLIYEVNTDLGYIKWIQIKQGYKVIEINFEGKRDVAMSLRFAIIQCLYELNTKRRFQDAIAEEQVAYLKRISEKPQPIDNPKIIKIYEDQKQQLQIAEPKFVYGNLQAQKGLEKYRTFCQAKINNFDVASLGSMLETLKISEDNKIVRLGKRKLQTSKGEQFNADNIVLHDNDQKAILNDSEGQLHYYDMEKGAVIQTYDLPHKGIQDICPQYKLAETKEYKTLKAISPNTIYEIDPRLKQGSQNMKSYQTSPDFNRIAVDCKGRFAVSSSNGEIRLFDQIGKNANCKYPGLGDPVLHLDSTKDGKWLLATFKTYLLLLPTQTDEEVSLYENKIKIDDRSRPIKLKVKLEHLQLCKVDDIQMVPAKFDERKGGKEMFIVSGFGEYVVIWNLAQVIRGELNNYKFTRIDGQIVQTEFMFDNIKKLIMTTNTGIVIKQNRIKN